MNLIFCLMIFCKMILPPFLQEVWVCFSILTWRLPVVLLPWKEMSTSNIFQLTGKHNLMDICIIRNLPSNRFTFRQNPSSGFIKKDLITFLFQRFFNNLFKTQIFYLLSAAIIRQSYFFKKPLVF